jgi:predicted MFS family arabinose efflux permease
VVTAAVPLTMRSRAVGVLIGGLTVANVAGVPLGTFVGQGLGWRVTFWLLAGGALVAVAVLLPMVPSDAGTRTDGPAGDTAGPPRVGAEFAAFRNRQLWVALATIAAFQTAVFGTFGYLSPLLTDAADLPKGAVPLVLVVFGVGAFVGSAIGGRLGDRNPNRLILGGLAVVTATLGLLASLGHVAPLVVALVGVLGVASFASAVPLTSRVIGLAGDAPTLASATGTSAFNVGNAIGPALGGVALAQGGPTAPALLGTAFAATALTIAFLGLRLARLPANELSGAESAQWREIPHHSRDSAPLNVCATGQLNG